MTPIKLAIILVILALLSGCSPLSALSGLMGGGPSIEAQAGKNNEKTTGVKVATGDKIEGETVTVSKAEKFNTVTATEFIHDERVPFWIWVLVILGWVLPSPIEIWRGLGNMIKGAVALGKKNPQ